ncbi:histidine kinase dimerization/phospho-acceptor domain-containing protein [Pontibacillus salicampi]|uniref:histidine kinase n=1 Tax=Pontibacillus salicampi TaxID=1449801 RepID=A0ABV6LKW4_9BACI
MKKTGNHTRSTSLLRKYIFILIGAILLFPISFPAVGGIFYLVMDTFYEAKKPVYYNNIRLEEEVHQTANRLGGASKTEIEQEISLLKEKYPQSSLFWVNNDDLLERTWGEPKHVKENWDATAALDFMKKSYYADPFTVLAFIGEGQDEGFMVFQISKEYLGEKMNRYIEVYGGYYYIGGVIAVFVLFLVISYIFFHRIRKRLVDLQQAMTSNDISAIPEPVDVGKRDEIGLLKETFNDMIETLKTSRKKEQEEERLRRELIANLSHDLRTPLTVLRGQMYTIQRQIESEEGRNAIAVADDKITYLSELIENLLSYSLLSSHRYPYHEKEVNLVQIIRRCVADWYAIFEQHDFEVDINLPEEKMVMRLDPKWLQRIVDNVFQNVLRHAEEGRYMQVGMKEGEKAITLWITDKGPGFAGSVVHSEGTGVGLRIIALMTKDMNIDWNVHSDHNGSTHYFVWKKPFHIGESEGRGEMS